MRTVRLLLLILGVAAATSGCRQSLFAPYDLGGLSLDLAVTGGEPVPTTITGDVGAVTLRSYHATPMCGYELSGSMAEGAEALEVRIYARFVGGFAVPCYYAYEAVVDGLPRGPHAITLVHAVDGAPATRVAAAVVRVR